MQSTALALRPEPGDAITQARQHLDAAKAIGRDLSMTLKTDAEHLAGFAADVASVDSVHPGVREEARKLASYAREAAARIERLLVAA